MAKGEHSKTELTNQQGYGTGIGEPYLLLSNSDGCFKVPLVRIGYCNSYNSSTEFHIIGNNDRIIVISRPILYYQKLLAPYGFIRIHHGTLINIAYIHYMLKGEAANEVVLTTGQRLIISRAKKNEVIQTLRHWSVEGTVEKHNVPITGKTIQDGKINKQDSQNTSEKNKN